MELNLSSLEDSKVWGAIHKLLKIESPRMYKSHESSQSSGQSSVRMEDGRQPTVVLATAHDGGREDRVHDQLNQTLLANERLLAWKDQAMQQMHHMQTELGRVKELQDEVSRQRTDIRVLNERLRMETMQSADFKRKIDESFKLITEMKAAHSKDVNELNTTRAQLVSAKHQYEELQSTLEQANEAIKLYESTKDMMLSFQKTKRNEFETKVKELEDKNSKLEALLNETKTAALCNVRASLQIVSEEEEEEDTAEMEEKCVQTEIEGDSLDRYHKIELEQLKSNHEYEMRNLKKISDESLEHLRSQVEGLERRVADGKEREKSLNTHVDKLNALLDAANVDNFQLKMEGKRLAQNIELMSKELEDSLAISREAEKVEGGLLRARSVLLRRWEEAREQVEVARSFSEWRRREERVKWVRRCIDLSCSISSSRLQFLLFKSAVVVHREKVDGNRRVSNTMRMKKRRELGRSCLQTWKEEVKSSSMTSVTVRKILQSFLVTSPKESFLQWAGLVLWRRRATRQAEVMVEHRVKRELERALEGFRARMQRRERKAMMKRKVTGMREAASRKLVKFCFLSLSDRARFVKDIW